MPDERIRRTAVHNTLSWARERGDAVIQASVRGEDAIEAILGMCPGQLLFSGKISDVDRRTTAGLARGSLEALGVDSAPRDQVSRLGQMAVDSGADGIVCSPEEIRFLRDVFGEDPAIVVPGVRMPGQSADDQKHQVSGVIKNH